MTADPAGERSTRQKRAVSALLAETESFRSAQDLHAELRARGERVGLTTIYTQLRVLADAGVVDVVRAEDGETLYRRCRIEGHHHHLLCRSCGRTVEVEPPGLEAWTAAIGERAGFSDLTHVLEIVGTCADCRRAEIKPRPVTTDPRPASR